jgi:hypothetical protein
MNEHKSLQGFTTCQTLIKHLTFARDVIMENRIRHHIYQPIRRKDLQYSEFFFTLILWPYARKISGGACYYILFKDDYTRYRFVYYIKNKLEALSCFKTLVKTIKKEFKCIVMMLKTNRSGKFCNKKFKQLLVAGNIIHEINMSYTI